MEGYLNRRWVLIIIGCGGTGGEVKRGRGPIVPVLCSLYAPSQSAIGPWDRGLPTVRGDVEPGELDFRPRGVGFVDVWKYV